MRGKYSSCILIKILLVYNINYSLADENKQEDEDKKSIEYFIHDNQLGSQWPHGIVPYYVNLNDYDNLVARRVRSAMNHLEDSSCIKFKQLLEAKHFAPWIHISNPKKIRECVHTRENKTTLEIPLVLGYECLQRREILHALMHAIGFKDEVTHPQRDQYVRVQWENINPKYHSLFRVRYDDFAPLKIEYDPNSIMHFHDRAFSINGHAAIAPQVPGLVINPTAELSPLDKMKLRMIFGHECNKRSVGDLLDSCRMAMRDNADNGSDASTNKEIKLTQPGEVDQSSECTKEDTNLDEPEGDNNKEKPEDQKDFDEPEIKDVDNTNDEDGKDDDEPELKDVDNTNDEDGKDDDGPELKGVDNTNDEDGKDDNGDEEALKKHRRHHRFNRYRQ